MLQRDRENLGSGRRGRQQKKHSFSDFSDEIEKEKGKTFLHTYLYSGMTAQIKVKFSGMCDSNVHRCSSRYIATLANLFFFIRTEEPGVMSFLNNNEGDAGLVVCFELHARFTDSQELVSQHLSMKSNIRTSLTLS